MFRRISYTCRYYDQIHTYLPLLPDNIPQLRSSLESVSHEIREAFTAALYAAVKSCDLSNVAFAADISNVTKSIKTASELLLVVQTEEPTNRTTAENAIYLQALILMIFVSEGSGPGRNQDSSWFGLAFSIATYLKLHVNYGAPFGTELHLKTGRKAWLILVILDRWHAASTSGPQIIADNESLELYLSDQALLGDTAFHLVRMCSPNLFKLFRLLITWCRPLTGSWTSIRYLPDSSTGFCETKLHWPLYASNERRN